jgi:hypothetical protein
LSFSTSSLTVLFSFASERRRRPPAFPGEDGGWKKILLRGARARGFAQSESDKPKAELGDPPDRRVSASDPRAQAFDAEKRSLVESAPNRSTSGEVWKDLARD